MLLRQPRRLIPAVVFIQLVAILSFVYLGSFLRMLSDDYCNALIGLQYGPIEGVQYQYNAWSGRYTGFFVEFLFAPAQPLLSRIFPILMIVSWLITLWLIFYTVAKRVLHLRYAGRIAMILAVGMSYTLLNSMPSPQNIYWYSALIPYVLSFHIVLWYMLFLTFYFLQDRSSTLNVLLIVGHCVFIFLMTGFSEVMATFLLTTQVLLWLPSALLPDAQRSLSRKLIVLGVLAGLAGIGVMMLSPGVAIRREAVEALTGFSHVTIPQLVMITLSSTGLFLFVDTFGLAHMLFILFSVFVGTMIYQLEFAPDEPLYFPQNPGRAAMYIIGASCLLIMSVLAPSIYAHGHAVPRTMVLARVVQMIATLNLGYLAAVWALKNSFHHRVRRSSLYRPVQMMLLAMMFSLPLITLIVNFSFVADFRTFAQGWDARHELLNNAEPGESIGVPDLVYYLEEYLDLDYETAEEGYASACLAGFYGLEEVQILANDIEKQD